MQISQRVRNMGEPALLKYYPLVDQTLKKGIKVYYLNIGQPDIKTPESFMKKVNETKKTVLSYSKPEGEKALREAAVKYYAGYGLTYDPSEMLITNGGSEALLFAFLSICNPDDEILTFEPLYSVYKEMAAASSVNLIGVKTYAVEGFAIPDRETIEKAITPKTKAILITSPGNPTGKVFTEAEVRLLCDVAKAHHLYIISDEVYREFIYEEGAYASPALYPDVAENCIIVDSISKRYSACGARIGFILSKNKELIFEVRKLCQMRLAVSSVDQLGAAELFKLDTGFFDEVLAEYTRRRDIVYEALKDIKGIVCKKPTGAFYYVLKLPIKDACHFIEWMITDFNDAGRTVLLSPANDFYLDPKDGMDEVRLAYVLNEEDMKSAMAVLIKGLATYQQAFPEQVKGVKDNGNQKI